jgi:hypothetical protein
MSILTSNRRAKRDVGKPCLPIKRLGVRVSPGAFLNLNDRSELCLGRAVRSHLSRPFDRGSKGRALLGCLFVATCAGFDGCDLRFLLFGSVL